jgi:predicted SnoaL-like aldol condensation-catalyzing enzyme
MSSSSVSDNVQTVRDFIKTAFNEGRAKEALEKYVGDQYIQHNPMVPDGDEGFIQVVKETIGSNPNYVFDTKRVIAQDDHVVLHSYMTLTGEGPGFAVMDIFRLEDGKIVEHWDVLQPVPEEPANDNTMF